MWCSTHSRIEAARACSWLLGLSVSLTALAGCAGQNIEQYAAEHPSLDLASYFNGKVVAHGIFQDRSGQVVRRFTVDMEGRWAGNQGVLDERFSYSDGTKDRRVWRLTKHADGRYTGTADDVVLSLIHI